MNPASVTVFVCTACQLLPEGSTTDEPTSGEILVAQLQARLPPDALVTVTPVDCLAVCNQPCTIAFSGQDKWTYLIGDINPDTDVDDILLTATRLAASNHPVLTLADRPAFFRKGVIARVPPCTVPDAKGDLQKKLFELLRWRRDVRHFRTDPVPAPMVKALIDAACLAPSVGNSQPWRFVMVDDPARRTRIIEIFEQENALAAERQSASRQAHYLSLKLAGLREIPIHLAVFCDEATAAGHGLGRATMPEMLRYSVVCAIQNLWLAARTMGIGVGWVSILSPPDVIAALDVPDHFTLVAYLCIGWPEFDDDTPELERQGWQSRLAPENFVINR